jgi:enoyl-[acyl-carrier protein] reductase III
MLNNPSLQGKIVLVTGSSRGIGKAIALKFASCGADVVINFIHNQKQAEEVALQVRELGRRAIVVRANVGKIDHIDNLFQIIEKEFKGLDFFISNAASGFNRPGLLQKPEGWDHTLNVNTRAFLFSAQRATPLMEKRGGGTMIAISSPGSSRVLPDYIAVGASKAALESLVRYLAVELAEKNIIVNGVAPGIIATDALQHFQALLNSNLLQKVKMATPAKRLVTPEDVANLVVFLCTPQGFMVRGQVIVIDGGFTLPFSF